MANWPVYGLMVVSSTHDDCTDDALNERILSACANAHYTGVMIGFNASAHAEKRPCISGKTKLV